MRRRLATFVLALSALLPSSLASSSLAGPCAFGLVAPGEVESDYYTLPDLNGWSATGLRDLIGCYSTDRGALRRFWDVQLSVEREAREREFYRAWLSGLGSMDFESLDLDARIDWLLLKNEIEYELRQLDLGRARRAETEELLPFAKRIAELQESRRRLEPVDAPGAAGEVAELIEVVDALKGRVRGAASADEDEAAADSEALIVEQLVANRAAGQVRGLRRSLGSWFGYFDGYDPTFSWWCREPYEALDEALEDYARHLREEVAGVGEDDDDTILGDPIGRDALLSALAGELIAYSPEELIEIAEREFAWCDHEMLAASDELGFGDDWRAALEHVKGMHVEPGQQPALIRRLHKESVAFLEENELLTIPPFAKNSWRMEMMSPERQKYTPYFTGGEVISVSFPTDGMEHADKLMSLRGNNEHFSRATVHHELIPGHHLQQYMNARFRSYRREFRTPFWGEGWALYWEMLLWDAGFQRSAEDRVGMLFWRRHRCARIVFSLRFHLGEMTPEECIDYLVERVGHERRNATAEVRRSVQGGYSPLYQAAYMVGGLQFRALHAELVGTDRMTDRAFHDAILREGPIPVELVRAKLRGDELDRGFAAEWRF